MLIFNLFNRYPSSQQTHTFHKKLTSLLQNFLFNLFVYDQTRSP